MKQSDKYVAAAVCKLALNIYCVNSYCLQAPRKWRGTFAKRTSSFSPLSQIHSWSAALRRDAPYWTLPVQVHFQKGQLFIAKLRLKCPPRRMSRHRSMNYSAFETTRTKPKSTQWSRSSYRCQYCSKITQNDARIDPHLAAYCCWACLRLRPGAASTKGRSRNRNLYGQYRHIFS